MLSMVVHNGTALDVSEINKDNNIIKYNNILYQNNFFSTNTKFCLI